MALNQSILKTRDKTPFQAMFHLLSGELERTIMRHLCTHEKLTADEGQSIFFMTRQPITSVRKETRQVQAKMMRLYRGGLLTARTTPADKEPTTFLIPELFRGNFNRLYAVLPPTRDSDHPFAMLANQYAEHMFGVLVRAQEPVAYRTLFPSGSLSTSRSDDLFNAASRLLVIEEAKMQGGHYLLTSHWKEPMAKICEQTRTIVASVKTLADEPA